MEIGILGKTAVCLVGGGGIAVAGCYAGGIIKFGEKDKVLDEKQQAEWTTLFQDSSFKTTYSTTGKIGGDYGKYLVNTKNNEEGGNESYKQYEKDIKDNNIKPSLSTEFGEEGKVTLAYSGNDDKALNKVCESIYKKETTSINFESGKDNEHNLGKDLLKYCSPLGQIPTIIPQDGSTYSSEKIGSKGNSKKLVSTQDKDQSNTKGFGEAQQKGFEKQELTELGVYFSQFFKDNEGSKKLEGNIKDICNKAYELTSTEESGTETTTSPKLSNVVKYCSFAKLENSSAG